MGDTSIFILTMKPSEFKNLVREVLKEAISDYPSISNNQSYVGKTSRGGYGHGATNDYGDVPLERDPLNDPRLTGKKPFKETVNGRVVHDKGYTFRIFSELAKGDGFDYPIDVKRGTIYLGTLRAMPNGFVVNMIETPSHEEKYISFSKDMPAYKSMLDAAKVLHSMWNTYK
jgi:hypothetical protein